VFSFMGVANVVSVLELVRVLLTWSPRRNFNDFNDLQQPLQLSSDQPLTAPRDLLDSDQEGGPPGPNPS